MLSLLRKGGKNTRMKISGSEIKQVDRFTCLGNMVEKNGDIQIAMNERIRKASRFCQLIKSILWSKEHRTRSVKLQYTRCILTRCRYMELRHGHALRGRKAKYKQLR
jgi:hypothetical protein